MSDLTVKAGRLPSEAVSYEYGFLPLQEDIEPIEEYVSKKLGRFSVAINSFGAVSI